MTPARDKVRPTRAVQRARPGHESAYGTKLSLHAHLKAQPGQNSPGNTHLKAQPGQNSPGNAHLKAQPVQNSPGTLRFNENRPFFTSRENLFPFPTPHHRAGRIFSRSNTTQHPYKTLTTTAHMASPRDKVRPTCPVQRARPGHESACGTKLSRQHPPQGPTGTKLSRQRPPQGPTGTKLSRHPQIQRKQAIFHEQGESFPVPNAPPPSRENFLPQQHHLGVYFNAADRLVPTFTRAPDQCTPQLGIVRVIGCSS